MKKAKHIIILIMVLVCFKRSAYAVVEWEEIENYIVNYNESNVIESLLKHGSNKMAVENAMKAKDYFSVVMLLEYGFDINFRNSNQQHTILEIAIDADEINLLEYFLANKADPTNEFYYIEYNVQYKKTAVYDAIMSNRLDIIKLFAEYGFNLNKFCFTRFAVTGSNVLKTSFYQTPLQAAVAHKKTEITKYLISIGVDI